jgi:hypothetical protein
VPEPDRLDRLADAVVEVERRLRDVETADRFRDGRVEEIHRSARETVARVERMDLEGTALTREVLRRFEDRIDGFRDDLKNMKTALDSKASAEAVQDLKDEHRSLQLILRGGVVTFATSIAVQIFVYFALRGH